MNIRSLLTLLSILFFSEYVGQYTYSGKVKDKASGEALIGVNVKVNDSKGAVTDIEGNFSLTLDEGSHKIMFSYVGYLSEMKSIEIAKNLQPSVFDRRIFRARCGGNFRLKIR